MRRNPIHSETDAFRLTVGGVILALMGIVVGLLSTPLSGVVAFIVLALVAFASYMSVPERDRRLPLREASREPHPHGPSPGTRHVLIVANEALAGRELEQRIRGLDGKDVEVDVVAPVLSSRAHLAYTDIDRELRLARERLTQSLQWAHARGFAAHGEVGGPSSPVTAIEDELRDFGPDEVIVVTSPHGPQHWQEQTEIERLRKELHVPVVQIAAATTSTTNRTPIAAGN